jgi:hypothetical protein
MPAPSAKIRPGNQGFCAAARISVFVAQTSSLPYRGFPTRQPDNLRPLSRLEVGDTADWKSRYRLRTHKN